MKEFHYGEDLLSPGLALELAGGKIRGVISEKAEARIRKCSDDVQTIVNSRKIVYGVNTGFGPLCTTIISEEDTKTLQYNILKSHSVGMGDDVDEEISALMLVLKMHALSKGYSGIQMETLERINWHIENRAFPVVPSQGSVGASGDLAPLAHLFLPLIGLGKVHYKGEIITGAELFERENLSPVLLGPKEGLALINGTQFIAAHAVKALQRMKNILDCADIIGAMSLEALLGSAKPFQKELHQIRPYEGTIYVADRLEHMLRGSEILKSHEHCERVQDPYSIRCMPQVHGASRNAWKHLKEQLTTELNSVTDNPIILNPEETISGGNFHGQPMALPLDYSTLASSELGNISDRRTYLLLEGTTEGLPKLLMEHTGINSGFMIPQYTSAALVTENKSLCFPPSADSVPTSLGQEDHVSMGSISGRRVNEVITNVEKILAVELVCAAQAFDYRRPLKSAPVLESCHHAVREVIDHAEVDRVFAHDLEAARKIIASGKLVETAEKASEDFEIDIHGGNNELFGLY
ncbi:histidine ammonia-lyase [Spirochaeta isovalerica]|uniref:Histidine ammonia-lyase n=1 Tax=Spirochaeta isovalerica TaxID=150 RepID=A0A841R6S5_9SPIO|nr:histidine ammonia-lyase [Spirochaeta isovalerica]MBB6479081.1 histidine ammonia-lyase [Spirochaeta isovalerica]